MESLAFMSTYKAYLLEVIVWGKTSNSSVFFFSLSLTERWSIGMQSVGTGCREFSHAWQVVSQQQRERQKEKPREIDGVIEKSERGRGGLGGRQVDVYGK